jgi:hypothetical protein
MSLTAAIPEAACLHGKDIAMSFVTVFDIHRSGRDRDRDDCDFRRRHHRDDDDGCRRTKRHCRPKHDHRNHC